MNKVDKFIQNYTRNCSNEMESPLYVNPKLNFYPWLSPDQARRAVEIAREEIYEWLLANADDYCLCAKNFEARRCINDIKQTIKDE